MNTSTSHTQAKKVLVIGGGIAGLLAARVLSEHYDSVTIIERDEQPEKPGIRPGVSQSFHLHQVLPRGEMLMERFFPGFSNDLLALGAFPFQPDTVVEMINQYGMLAFPNDGENRGMTYSRALLEWALRQRVQAISNVHFLYHQDVIGLETSSDHTRVTGVSIRERGQIERQEHLFADLVVDASGRSSKLSSWLSALDYEVPEEERVKAGIGYTTRYYKVPSGKKGALAVMVVEGGPATGNSAGGVIKRMENDTWAVCLTGIGGQYPPTDAKGFEEGFSRLISPALAEALQGAEPLTEPRGYRIPECIRHHYELMEQWPAGLLVLGDALCHFDPVYGQGMTIAAIEVEAIDICLREQQDQPGFERRILQKMQEAIFPAWWRNTIEDLNWSGVTYSGHQPLKNLPLLQRYFDLCLKQSTRQLEKLQQAGEFNPLFFKYFLMNWLLISPNEVINADMLASLLESETPSERQAILAELFQGYDQPVEKILAEIVPDFSHSFDALFPVPSNEETAAS